MPLVASEMKAKFQDRIHSGLSRVFADDQAGGRADEQWQKMADAISDIAMDIVTEITTNAMVVPGQAVVTAGGPTNQAGSTVSPGMIK